MRCGKCGEPWDLDSIHDEISYISHEEIALLKEKYKDHPKRYHFDDPFQAIYEKKYFNPAIQEFRRLGCEYFLTSHNDNELSGEAKDILNVTYELLGDDVDGIQSLLEDMDGYF